MYHKKAIYPMLYDFQKKCVIEADRHRRFGVLLDMGLGKTLTSLAIAQDKMYDKIVILCQNTKVIDWEEEVVKYFHHKVVLGNKGKERMFRDAKKLGVDYKTDQVVTIIPFSSAWRWEKELLDEGVIDDQTLVIIDECQFFKSHTTSVGKFGYKISQLVSDMLFLSGDPISNGYVDLYNLFRMMDPHWNLSFDNFQWRYCNMRSIAISKSKPWMKIPMIMGYKNVDEMLDKLKSHSFLMKTEEAIELPDQVWSTVKTEPSNQVHKKIMKHKSYKDLYAFETGAQLLIALRQCASGFVKEETGITDHKINALKDLLQSSKEDYVIFYNFQQERLDILALLDELGIKAYEYNGQSKSAEGMPTTEKKRRCIVSQYLSGAVGKNWQFMNHMIYYSPTLSGTLWKQSMKRIHRVGQSNRCFYYKLVTRDSVDAKIYKSLEKSEDYTNAMFLKDFGLDLPIE